MKIHAYYSQPHYGEHLQAIHRHLPDAIRGQIHQTRFTSTPGEPDDLVMVAGVTDIPLARGRRVVFVEHGAGQRYTGITQKVQPYYGGPYPNNVIAYLGPRQSCVDDVGLPGFAMGAPVCDPYDLFGRDRVCAITWHWKARQVCPEADTALPHYINRLPDIVAALRDHGWEVLGHRHPRLRSHPGIWKKLGVEEVTVDVVRHRASLLIADNTSLAYEMQYLWRDNICLNAPWYRRNVEHGLRFWEAPPGPMVENADELIDLIEDLDDVGGYMEKEHVPFAYERAQSDGQDGLRAATWVTAFAAGL